MLIRSTARAATRQLSINYDCWHTPVDRNEVLVMGFYSQDILSKILESFGREESAMTLLQRSLGYKPA